MIEDKSKRQTQQSITPKYPIVGLVLTLGPGVKQNEFVKEKNTTTTTTPHPLTVICICHVPGRNSKYSHVSSSLFLLGRPKIR